MIILWIFPANERRRYNVTSYLIGAFTKWSLCSTRCRYPKDLKVFLASQSRINKHQISQNKLVKLLTRKDRLYSTNALHTDLNILKVKYIHETAVLQFVYSCIKETPIVPFVEYSKLRRDEHNYDLRNNDNISTRTIHINMGKGTTQYTGATLWNKLPSEITEIDQANVFKRELLAFYQSKYLWLISNTERDSTWPNRPIRRCVIKKNDLYQFLWASHGKFKFTQAE